MPKISFYFLFIVILAFILRIIFLDRIPTGISNDELNYILNAKAVWLSGSDISHTWNPFSLTNPLSSFPQAEIVPLVTFLFVGILPLSLLWSKLIYAIFSTGIVIMMYGISKKLLGSKEAITIGVLAAINPWLIFFGRTAYDVYLALFFFLLALFLLLTAKGWKILLVFIPFFLGFYSYIGAKVIFIPYVAITSYFTWHIFNKNKYGKQYILLCLLSFLLFGYFIFSLQHQSTKTRLSEIDLPTDTIYAAQVDAERRQSIHTPITSLFANKPVLYGKNILNKYLNAFSPNFLFLSGDGKELFSVWYHGEFYYIDAFFILLGFIRLWSTQKKIAGLLTALLIIAPFPSVFSSLDTSYATRSFLLGPVLLIVIGTGVAYVFKKSKLLALATLIAYAILFLNFINIYFFRNPIYNSESFSLSERELIKYISFQSRPIYVVNGDPRTPLNQYLFYTNGLNRQTSNKIASIYVTKKYIFNNIHFVTCLQGNTIPKNSLIIYDDPTCKTIPFTTNKLYITRLGDGGRILTIANDTTCSKYQLSPYPNGITFNDLLIEKLSEKEFCEKFISK